MIHVSENNVTPATPMKMLEKLGQIITWVAAVPSATRTFRHRAELAHASRCNLASVSEKEVRDSGLDPSDATGIAAWQPDLPFFMQSGFGQK